MRNKRKNGCNRHQLRLHKNISLITAHRYQQLFVILHGHYEGCVATFLGFVFSQHHHDSISSVTYCAITLNRILLLLNDPLCHPSFRASLPPALNQTMLGAVGCQDPQCTLQNGN